MKLTQKAVDYITTTPSIRYAISPLKEKPNGRTPNERTISKWANENKPDGQLTTPSVVKLLEKELGEKVLVK